MNDALYIHINDRGLTRQIDELWAPHLGADVVWLAASDHSTVHSAYTDRLIPIIEVSPAELATLAAEQGKEGRCALAIFRSLEQLVAAADYGLAPQTVNLVSLQSSPGTRLAPDVWLDDDDVAIGQQLIDQGFRLFVQPLPNVTARPLSVTCLNAANDTEPEPDDE